MAFDPSRLKTQLLNTGLSVKDQPQYQLINSMIDAISSLTASVTNIINNNSTSTIINNVGQFSVLLEDFSAFDEGILGSPYGNLSLVHTGSGLNGQVAFWTSAVNLSGDNGLFWDNTNKRLGVGTAVPVNNLHISVDGSTPNSSLFAAADQLIISNTNAVQLRLLAAGVGITTQIEGMKVGGTLASPSATTTGDNLFGVFGQGYDGTTRLTASKIVFACEGTISSGILPGNIQISTTNPSGALIEAIRIDSGQRVGIGTTAPLAKLEVVGVSQTPTDHSTHFELSTGTGVLTDNKLVFGVHDGDYSWIQAVKAGTNYFNLILNPQAGNVGIGTISPVTLLDVHTARTNGASVNVITMSDNVTGAQTANAGCRLNWLSNNGSTIAGIAFEVGGTGANNESQIRFLTQNVSGSLTAWMTLSSLGILSNVGFGGHSFSASGTGDQTFTLANTLAGTANRAYSQVQADVGAGGGRLILEATSSTWTTSADSVQKGARVASVGAGGLSISSIDSAAPIRFYTGSTPSERMRLFASGGLSLGNTTDPGLGNVSITGSGGTRASVTVNQGAFGAAIAGAQLFSGNNTSGSGAPGTFAFTDRSSSLQFVFVDTLGVLRIVGTSPPTENGGACDLTGTIIGFQTEKNNLSIPYDGTNNNDQNPGTGNVLRVTNNGTNTATGRITGLSGGVAGRVILIINDDTQLLTLPLENVNSTAANRFYDPSGVTAAPLIPRGGGQFVYYSSDASRWVVIY